MSSKAKRRTKKDFPERVYVQMDLDEPSSYLWARRELHECGDPGKTTKVGIYTLEDVIEIKNIVEIVE